MGVVFGPSTSHPSNPSNPSNATPGASFGGGFVMCKAGGIVWIVSPYSAEVTRTWYLREDANTTAQAVSGCTGWFVPTVALLQNPGSLCRAFWGPSPCFGIANGTQVWSSKTYDGLPYLACFVCIQNGIASNGDKTCPALSRAFRCVTY